MSTFQELFTQLLLAFPDAKKHVGKETRALYQRKLADIPDHILERAVDAYIDTGKWFPKIAELREESRRIANLPTRLTSFEVAEPDEPTNLLAEWIALEDSLSYDPAAYLVLANRFDKVGKTHRADAIRKRAAHYARPAAEPMKEMV